MLTPSLTHNRKVALATGDLAMFLLFSAVGRRAHSMGSALDDIVGTALPFVIGWFLVAPFTGAYGQDATTNARIAGRTALLTWLLAFPLGLLIRIPLVGRVAHPSFAIVAGLFTLVVLVAWRAVYGKATTS